MAVIAVTVIIVYYRFDPTASWWMPRCPSKLLTGYDCPGCGSQRMLHALLHGDIAAAWRFNPFILLSLPFLAVAIWGNFSSLHGSAKMRAVAHSPYVVWVYIIAFFGWWILRNL